MATWAAEYDVLPIMSCHVRGEFFVYLSENPIAEGALKSCVKEKMALGDVQCFNPTQDPTVNVSWKRLSSSMSNSTQFEPTVHDFIVAVSSCMSKRLIEGQQDLFTTKTLQKNHSVISIPYVEGKEDQSISTSLHSWTSAQQQHIKCDKKSSKQPPYI
ncbi:ATP-dependent dethiobiotin synthetase BioD, partial [Striga asiatica]